MKEVIWIFLEVKHEIEENSGAYQLEILYKDHEKMMLEVDLKTSINVGTINV